MVQMNWSVGQKLRHRCREQTYGHQEGKVAGGGWWCCYVCLGLRGTSLKGKTVEGRDGELRENNLAERGELKDDE